MRPVHWVGSPFGKFQALPKDGRPITAWSNRDEAFENVVLGIRNIVRTLLLEEQIEQIKSAAVFVGDDGVGPWQRQEMDAFLREFANRGCPVIPVLLNNAPLEPKLPLFLRGITWVDFRKQEPIPLRQLIWGITGERDFG